ncbi:hypothetical protein Dsin_000231, partial [Dipteronia sinensis]
VSEASDFIVSKQRRCIRWRRRLRRRRELRFSYTEKDLAASLAKYTTDLSYKFGKERGSFTVVLSGGFLIKSLRVNLFLDYIADPDFPIIEQVPIVPGHVYAINDALSTEGHPLCKENEKWVTFIKDSPKPPPERITFTFPVINSAAYNALVICGAEKAGPVQAALGNSQNSDVLPVQMVSAEEELTWFLDKEAASKL